MTVNAGENRGHESVAHGVHRCKRKEKASMRMRKKGAAFGLLLAGALALGDHADRLAAGRRHLVLPEE